ncbi:MAG: hypothetical protein ACRCYX_03080 [Dermatophilaceae bacterium]
MSATAPSVVSPIRRFPTSWRSVLVFIGGAPVLLALVAWLTTSGYLPLRTAELGLGDIYSWFRAWFIVAIFLGTLLPLIAWIAWWRVPQLRRGLGLFLLVLLAQLASEIFFSIVFFPSMVVVVGTVYSAFRSWQLWAIFSMVRRELPDSTTRTLALGLVATLLLFWGTNLVGVLLVSSWPVLLAPA